MARQPNPSFIVLDVQDPAKLEELELDLLNCVPDEAGSPLSPLGSNRYVVSRSIAKRLGINQDNFQQILKQLPGVELARRMRADQIRALYGALDPADTSRIVRKRSLDESPEEPDHPAHLVSVGFPDAWTYLREMGVESNLGNVWIALIDTGYTRHSFFGFEPESGDRNACVLVDRGEDYLDHDPPLDPVEDQYFGHPGHGTRVGSVIAACASIDGNVKSGAKLVPFRVTRCAVIENDTPLDRALRDAWDRGCRVANISLGDPCFPGTEIGKAIDEVYDAGMIVVAAAGNVTSEVTYPGRYARTITAGGVSWNEGRWKPWSNGARGPKVDFCAPADQIERADWKYRDSTWHDVVEDGGDGTSYAAAHISGLAGLWLARWDEELSNGVIRGWQVVEAFRKTVEKSCSRPNDWNCRLFGHGIIDAEKCLKQPLPMSNELIREEDEAAKKVF